MYKCPRCGEVGEHERTTFGPEGAGRNLERYCSECSKKFIADRSSFRSNDLPERILEIVEERTLEQVIEKVATDIAENEEDVSEEAWKGALMFQEKLKEVFDFE